MLAFYWCVKCLFLPFCRAVSGGISSPSSECRNTSRSFMNWVKILLSWISRCSHKHKLNLIVWEKRRKIFSKIFCMFYYPFIFTRTIHMKSQNRLKLSCTSMNDEYWYKKSETYHNAVEGISNPHEQMNGKYSIKRQ